MRSLLHAPVPDEKRPVGATTPGVLWSFLQVWNSLKTLFDFGFHFRRYFLRVEKLFCVIIADLVFNSAVVPLYKPLYCHPIRSEVFFPKIDLVDAMMMQRFVQSILQGRCVLTADHHVNIERKRYGSPAQFIDAFQRLESPCHADFENSFTKRADIGNNVDVSRFNAKFGI